MRSCIFDVFLKFSRGDDYRPIIIDQIDRQEMMTVVQSLLIKLINKRIILRSLLIESSTSDNDWSSYRQEMITIVESLLIEIIDKRRSLSSNHT